MQPSVLRLSACLASSRRCNLAATPLCAEHTTVSNNNLSFDFILLPSVLVIN
jgi:hypothetical protein